jgi:hypothetical protein
LYAGENFADKAQLKKSSVCGRFKSHALFFFLRSEKKYFLVIGRMLGSNFLELLTPWLEARELACGCLKLFLANF